MSQLSRKGMALLFGVALATIAVAFGIALWRAKHESGPSGSQRDRRVLFREAAGEAGLAFEMHFLPDEQGEKFKINLYDHGSGVAIGDFDGDGRDDLYFCNQLGPNALYRNWGDGTFEDVTATAGVGLGDRVCVAATFADYDNDGDQDLYVTSTRGGNVLFRNEGRGRFKDVTKQAGLTHTGHSQTALFFDYDGDGWLDLFVANTAEWTTQTFHESSRYFVGKGDVGGLQAVITSPKESNLLYRNNGDGTFTDVTARAGLKGLGWAGDAAAFDYNEDGLPDLLVTNMFGRAQLYRNNRGGTFTDVTLEVLGRTSWGGLGVKPFDFNNDGRLDVYLVDMHSDMWMGLDATQKSLPTARRVAARKFPTSFGPMAERDPQQARKAEQEMEAQVGYRREEVVYGNTFFRNEGGGKFSESSDRANLETFWPWGIATGDFDNDGHEDVFSPAGMGFPFYYWPNYLLMNNGDETFTDRASEAGIEPPPRGQFQAKEIGGLKAARSSRAAAVADFDGDGRLDIVVNNFNDRPYYFRNASPAGNYLAFRLQGTRSNRDAIGALVHVHAGSEVFIRQVHGACGYLAQSSRTLHFGLGERTQVDRVDVRWPSGARQTIQRPALNQLHPLTEPNERGAKS